MMCFFPLHMFLYFQRMLGVSRLASYWAAAGLPWHSPVTRATKAFPRISVGTLCSSKVRDYQYDSDIRIISLTWSESLSVQSCSFPHHVLMVHVCVLSSFTWAGWPKLLWVVTESKHLSKPPREWYPLIKDANNDTGYIEVFIYFYFLGLKI